MTLPSTEPQVATPIDAATAPLTVRDVMTIDVINIPRTMPVAAIARTLSERSMSGVPVTDEDGMLVGIVTEVDLIRCLFNDKTADHGFIAKLLGNHDWQARRYTRTHGRIAADVMTATPLYTVNEDTPVADVAAILAEQNIRRLPVVRSGRLVGIVSRVDLLRVALEPARTTNRSVDHNIEREIMARMRREAFAANFHGLPQVIDGVVVWEGYVPSDEVRRALCVLAEGVDGVIRVDDRMEQQPFIPFVPYPAAMA